MSQFHTAQTLHDVLSYLGQVIEPVVNTDCQHLVLDSRHVQAGDVFCALAHNDAQRSAHIQQALAQGAVAILSAYQLADDCESSVPLYVISDLHGQIAGLANWFYGHPSHALTVIGVTGTNGKTSICHYLAQFLSHDQVTAVLGTVGNGIWPELLPSSLTTLDCCALQRQLRDFVRHSVQYVVMEVSSHALAQHRVQGMRFDTAVFANFTQDHLDYHGDMHTYAAVKAELFRMPGLRCAVLNRDSEFFELMAQQQAAIEQVYTFGHRTPATVRLQSIQCTAQGIELTVATPSGQLAFSVGLLGAFNADNILAVIGVLLGLGYAPETLPRYLSQLHAVRGRMQVLSHMCQPTVVIDYAHTPDAMAQALQALRLHCHGHLWVVFGCGGDRDAQKRPLMAAVAERYADCIVVTEDNARFESPCAIFDDILRGFVDDQAVHLVPKRDQAIAFALSHAVASDVVALLGKGHETYLDQKGHRRPFDEYQLVKSLWGKITCTHSTH